MLWRAKEGPKELTEMFNKGFSEQEGFLAILG